MTYDATRAGGSSSFRFDNDRNGGYAQVTYRPTASTSRIIQSLEPVFRYDRLEQDDTPVGNDEQRYRLGLNYWITPKAVFKAAIQHSDKDHGEEDQNAALVEFAAGF